MAFSNSDVTFDVLFSPEADKTSGTITITDTSDLVGNGISLSDAAFAVNGWEPSGGQFRSGDLATPDVADESITRSFTFAMPTGSDGLVQEGTYQFQLLIRGIDAGGSADYNSEKLFFELCIVCPDPRLVPDIDCLCGIIEVRDATDYSGWTTTSRLLEYRYPGVGLHANITSTGLVVSTVGEDIWSGTGACQLTWTGTKNNLECSISYTIDVVANCDFDQCSLLCCLEALYQRIVSVRNGRGSASDLKRYEEEMEEAVMYTALIAQSSACGQTANVSKYIADFRALTNCNANCGCSDSTPTRIVPICSPTSGTAITVVDDGVYTLVTLLGSTYTVTLRQLYKDILNNTLNSVITSADSSITVTPTTDTSTSPDTVTYDLSIPAATLPADFMQFTLEMAFTNGNPFPVNTVSTPEIRGTKFQFPTTITMSNSTPDSLEIGGFYIGTPGTFVVRVDVLDIVYDSSTTSGTYLQQYATLEPTQHTWSSTDIARFGLTQVFPTVGAYDTWFRWGNIFDSMTFVFTFTEVP
jgi:hypothetical protein